MRFRYKSVIIPKIGNKYIIVKDRQSGEWTFAGGGCKKRYSIYSCGMRELLEETGGTVRLSVKDIRNSTHYGFISKWRSDTEKKQNKKEKINVTVVFNVFVVDYTGNIDNLKERFDASISNETSDISIRTKKQMLNMNMWELMRENVLPLLV